MPGSKSKAWVTLALDEDQVIQALVLGQSLRRVLTSWKLVVFTSNNSISNASRVCLDAVFDAVIVPEGIHRQNGVSDELFCKINCWNLYWADRCIFVYPDALFIRNCDEIMENSGQLLVSLDDTRKNFSDGLFSCEPSLGTFKTLLKFCSTNTIKNDALTAFKLHWGKDLNTFDGDHLLTVDPLTTSSPLLEKVDVPVARLLGVSPTTVSKLRDHLQAGNYVKVLLSQWTEIFNNSVQPLIKSNGDIHTSGIKCLLEKDTRTAEPIAIVGMSCRMPGANDLAEFWKLLIEGGDGVGPPPQERLPAGVSVDSAKHMKAGFLKCPVNECDGKFFGMSPLEISFLDPQTRLLLEVMWEALEDASVDPLSLKGTNTGIFTGAWTQDYKELINQGSNPTHDYFRKYMGNSFGACAGRLSFILGVNGPNVATESGCSSSMIGLDIACKSLRLGEAPLAISCGVNLVLHHFMGNDMEAICSKDGHCKTFDISADGFGRAEGCGVLILKRYSDAVRDGDRIHALIRGMGAAQEGTSRSLGTPTVACEAAAMKLALKNAGLKPSQVSFVESHGTGTPVGDPMEMAAIAEAYSEGRTAPLIVGSVKTNTGHTESCSGITGIIKTVLSLQNEVIPPHINFKTLNPNINLDACPALIPLTAVPWPRVEGTVRYAGVSSFGITGTDAHAILEEAPKLQPRSFSDFGMTRPQHILTLSAKSDSALEALLSKYKAYLTSEKESVGDIAFTANTGRAHFNHRAAIIGKTAPEMIKNIAKKAYAQGKVSDEETKICFLFTGQGSQYVGMGKTLYETSPVFKANFDICDNILRKSYGVSIRSVLWSDDKEQKNEISRTIYSQTSIFCIEYCLLKLWESWGVKPDCVLGHSLGEFAAAVAAGILSLEDALTLVAERTRLIDDLPRGQMIVVKKEKDSVDNLLKKFSFDDEKLSLDFAAVNSDEQTVLAGDTETVQQFSEFCTNNKIKSIILEATHAFHSKHMDPMLVEYSRVASKIKYQTQTCKFVSGMDGKVMTEGHVDGHYWVRHTRQSVNFREACKVAYGEGCRLFMEIGPQPVLSALTMANSSTFETSKPPDTIICLPSLRKNTDEWATILNCVSKLYTQGVTLNWKNFDKFYERKKVALPTYPFQRKKIWFDSKSSDATTQLVGPSIHPLIGCVMPNATSNTIYQGMLDLNIIPYVKDHMIGDAIIYPGAGFLEMSLAGGYATTQGFTNKFEFASCPISFENFVIEAPLELLDTEGCPVQVIVSPEESTGSNVTVYRNLSLADGNRKWIRHSSGTYHPFALDYTETSQYLSEDLSSLRNRIQKNGDIDKFYRVIEGTGLKFGPTFKSLSKSWKEVELGESLTLVQVPSDSGDYLCHPVIIDAMIQSLIATKYDDDDADDKLQVPVRIDKFIWFGKVETETVYTHCFPRAGSTAPQSVALYSPNGQLLALMDGAELISTSVPTVLTALRNQKITLPPIFEDFWKPLKGTLEDRADLFEMYDKEILPKEFLDGMSWMNEMKEVDKVNYPHLNRLCYLFIQKALYSLGWKPTLGEVIRPSEFCEQLSILKSHERLVNRLLMILGEEGYLSGLTNSTGTFVEWTVKSLPPVESSINTEIDTCLQVLGHKTTEAYATTDIIAECGWKLDLILLGKMTAVDLMFQTHSLADESRADKFYRLSVFSKYSESSTKCLTKLIEQLMALPEERRGILRILEVGAGTGSLTQKFINILEELKAPYHYTYTDISPAFFVRAKTMFEGVAKKMSYEVFDLEKDPFGQGLPPNHFDLIITTNVLHICKDLSQCARNLRHALVDGGLLYIEETTTPTRDIDLTFGLFNDYWLFDDIETRQSHCTISAEKWEYILVGNGFEGVVRLSICQDSCAVICGRASRKTKIPYHSKQLRAKPRSWIIFSGADGSPTDFFSSRLQSMGRTVSLIRKAKKYEKVDDSVYELCPFDKSEMASAFSEITSRHTLIEGIIYGWGDDGPETDQRQICEPFLYLSQLIGTGAFKTYPKVFFLTSGTHQVGDHVVSNPAGNTLWGMARTIRMEMPALFCKGIDLDPNDSSDLRLEQAYMEMWITDGEFQVSFRQKARNVLRFTNAKFNSSALLLPNSPKYSLALPASKMIGDLRVIPNSSVILKENEVEIQTCKIALNFKDIFTVLKPIKVFDSFNSIGVDFSGVITAVGSNVKDKRAGDRVYGCVFDGGAAPSHHVLPSNAVMPIPEDWTFSEAATLPVVFATAYYCMVTVADLKANETILIHAASGGVGLIAIQLAKYLGVKIIATAGTERKRAYLRNLGLKHVFNSRTLDYEKKIKEVTGGRGVDMVLNCLTGPGFKEASLNASAPGARFVEMSKIDVWEPEEVFKTRPDVQYTIVDLTTVSIETWIMLQSKTIELSQKNIIRPIPYVSFEYVHVREALNYLQKAKHIGKVILDMPSSNDNSEPKFNLFNGQSTYLITGGLGGIGLEVAKWMSTSGAKHIVLVGRSLPNTTASETMESLRSQGVHVVALQIDVGHLDQCQQLLSTIREPSMGLPPLRGIMHAAGTLSDGLLDKQNWSKFNSTFLPKVNGGWNLHTLTLDYPLEHFVMYSSVVALIGNIGQTNHSAGNAFLDALAAHRMSIGLPALTVNWGQWGEVGVAVEIKNNVFRPFSPREGILALERLMKSHKVQGTVVAADFSVARKLTPSLSKYFEELRFHEGTTDSSVVYNIDKKAFQDEFSQAGESDEKIEVIKKYVEMVIRQTLKMDAEDEIDPNQNFSEIGIDSLMLVEIKNAVQSLIGNDKVINPNDLAESQTLQLFSAYIMKLMIEAPGTVEN